jgi:uncharacterized 2Fe-2S/4Fe-4S cluster protein (DUF4445 family)
LTKRKLRVVFQPSGRRGRVEGGKTLLEASRELGVDIESICGGKQLCGKCKVKVERRDLHGPDTPRGFSHVSDWQPSEDRFIDAKEKAKGYRLACAARLRGDVLAFVPEESRAGKQVIRKAARDIEIKHNPAVKQYYVELSKPSLDDPIGDFERLAQKISETYGLKGLAIDYFSLLELPGILRIGNWKVTVAVWNNREIVRVQPGRVEECWGIAVDIGTTTVAVYLCSLKTGKVHTIESMMNPQVTYGEDVMSRITYSVAHPDKGLQEMSNVIIEGLNGLIVQAGEKTGIGHEDIVDMTLVGNTTMHHLLLKIDPQHIGSSPFTPAVHKSMDIKARDLGIRINRSSYVHILPVEAGFVGPDNVGVLICEEPYRKGETQLIIDIGTNGELVLGNNRRLISASCATGPALEGAQITFGMRAAPGAIERIRIDAETFEVNYKVIGKEEWSQYSAPIEMEAKGICGSGILDLLGELYRTGIVKGTGAFNRDLEIPRLRSNSDGTAEFVIAWTEETSIGKDIVVTQKDIRQIQLAKAAIYAGAKLMMQHLGIDHADRVLIAGAFGNYVDREEALIIGMLPDISPEKIISVGNAAGDGARIALLNREKREEADRVAQEVEYMELTTQEGFQDEFVAALNIPHSRDPFPHLKGIVSDDILNQ